MADFLEFVYGSHYQKLAIAFSLIYIFLAVRNNPWAFVFGLVGAFFWAIESYFNLQLKFDAALQVFYMIMSVWGLWQWLGDEKGKNRDQTIKKLSRIQHLYFIMSGAILTFILVMFINPLIDTEMPVLDAGTTVYSILATYLLVQRYIENWLYFVVINVLYIYIYNNYNAHFFTAMMIIYLVMAILGYLSWNKMRQRTAI